MTNVEYTSDRVNVAHGRWEELQVDYIEDTDIDAWQTAKCTNCGKYHTTPYLYYFKDYEFCPSCGARMMEDQHLTFADQSGAEYADNPTV